MVRSTSASTRGSSGARTSPGLLKTAFYLAVNHAPVNQIALKGVTESENPTEDTRLYISNENSSKAYDAFMTGEKGTRNPEREEKAKKVKKPAKASTRQRAGERPPPGRGHGGARRAAG